MRSLTGEDEYRDIAETAIGFIRGMARQDVPPGVAEQMADLLETRLYDALVGGHALS